MSKTIKGKKVGRLKEVKYESIFPNYKDDDLRNKKMVIPKIIKHNIGLRLQSRLTKDQAKFVAKCNSIHRDISLNF